VPSILPCTWSSATFFGSLDNPRTGHTYLISAKLTLPDGSVKTTGIRHNQVARSFSGFIYTVAGTSTQNFSVQVQVKDAADTTVIVGISPVVPFTSQAGVAQIPVFSYSNTGLRLVLAGPTANTRFGSRFGIKTTVSDTSIEGVG